MSASPARKGDRLEADTAGILEDRIEENKYDFEAYLSLARFQRDKAKLDEAREAYEKLLRLLPACASVWIEYADLEASASEFQRVEQIFTKCLQSVLNVELWSYYLAYIKRMNDLSTGGAQARATVAQAYEFVLSHVGFDVKAGSLWLDYIQFIRRTYQRAVVIPLNSVEQLWREYDSFENTVSKATARKFLSERSPAYMTARACARELLQMTEPLRQATFPALPTRNAAENSYVTSWRRWIGWEKQDPLELDDPKQLQSRVKYAYKQCLQFCRFFPEMWFDAAFYAASIGENDLALYQEGLEANPTSWLLGFAYAEAEELAKHGDVVKGTFDKLISSNKEAMSELESQIDEAAQSAGAEKKLKIGAEDDDDSDEDEEPGQDMAALANVEELRSRLKRYAEEGTTAYIMYMRAMRRLEGIKAARAIFARAIKESKHTWHIYVASALMEHHCSKDSNVAVKIFGRGLKHHSENPDFVLEYLNFLIAIKDDTNARALFEQTTAKLEGHKAVKLFERFYEYESMYGDLITAQKMATRMSEIDPSANVLTRFGKRFTFSDCDPIASRDLGLTRLPAATGPFPPPPPPLSLPPFAGMSMLHGDGIHAAVRPPPAPVPPAVLDLLTRLPPSSAMDSSRQFHAKALVDVVASLDLEAYQAKQQKQAKSATSNATKRKAAAAAVVPPPEELRALGKHNDAKDIYNAKRRA
ncbi:hypothetical protein BCR37DRAFT_119090 [Protomyces lactucae-debilis]|uniref:mRNA 3'-end-processing protein RNA14 n=1 Tax=Protomyces lactucae-debilis TaxID=2754530 RepID=A0A1Y2F1U4_PROLT|nr:uncharacterized protein BCR37DRAFT_119090 [Protomyces lactucae-debilis]ORY77677.1 hypothetical protein BCR37DRAFT_119090 [Protomyces lactucae-debilis]